MFPSYITNVVTLLTFSGKNQAFSTRYFRSGVQTNRHNTVFCEISQIGQHEGKSHWPSHIAHIMEKIRPVICSTCWIRTRACVSCDFNRNFTCLKWTTNYDESNYCWKYSIITITALPLNCIEQLKPHKHSDNYVQDYYQPAIIFTSCLISPHTQLDLQGQ